MAYDAALGINWLHGICSIVHRDLKPANLLLDENGRVKVTDFGFSEIIKGHGKDQRGPKGTALYMAPEVMRCEPFDFASDAHSFGLILYEMVTGCEPFEHYTDLVPFMQALCYDDERPTLDDDSTCPCAVVDLMKRCWVPEPEKRPQFPEIVQCLENILIDIAITSEPARAFWKTHFSNPLQEHVVWQTAAATFAKQLGVPPAVVNELRELLLGTKSRGEAPETHLSMGRFNQLCLWFGQWYVPSGVGLFREMLALVKQPWFHGDIQIGDAIARLHMRADGCFLVRLSFKDQRTPFTLSSISNHQCEHRRIYRLYDSASGATSFAIQIEGISAQFKKYSTLAALISNLVKENVITEPCPKGSNLSGYQ
jgi:hypothetical protein